MARLAIFVERYTIARGGELEALMRYKEVAERRGHEIHYLFRPELRKIPHYDALYIRALTDPLNASYVAARIAEMHGLPVIDDPSSIRICCDKVNMYRQLQRASVLIPETRYLSRSDLTPDGAQKLLLELGSPLVLKAPHSSFSSHVEKASTPDELITIGKRFLHRSDRILAQSFVPTSFDWRVGVLAGEPLYACRYTIPEHTFKIHAQIDGRKCEGRVEGSKIADVPKSVIDAAVNASNAIGQGLYGVDLKLTADGLAYVIEVNDNPTINAGEEDQFAPDIYERIVCHLLEGKRDVVRTQPMPARSETIARELSSQANAYVALEAALVAEVRAPVRPVVGMNPRPVVEMSSCGGGEHDPASNAK